MICRPPATVTIVLTCLLSSLSGAEAFAFAQSEPGVIHALLVGDSDSTVGESASDDVFSLRRALAFAFEDHSSRLRLYPPLLGQSVTVSAVETFFKDLKSRPEDTLLFYYSGHGEIRPELGHVLNFANPDGNGRRILPRSELLGFIKAKNPRLTVLVTDCCSAIRKHLIAPALQAPFAPYVPPKWAVAGCLLLQHRGVVDITASCPGQAAFPNFTGVGGIFTDRFAALLDRFQLFRLDKNKDGFVDWNEFYPELEHDAQRGFASLQDTMKMRKRTAEMQGAKPELALSEDENQVIRQPTQKSWTCSILPFLRVGVRVVDSPDGLRLEEIYPGSPASMASGLVPGLTIIGVGDAQVRNEKEFVRAVDATSGDKPLVLKLREPGSARPRTVTIRLRDDEIPEQLRNQFAPRPPVVPRTGRPVPSHAPGPAG
jgi:hypothetical protein